MSSSEYARSVVAEISSHNLDTWVRPGTLTKEAEESVRGHIHQELTSWIFYRKLAADCSRANIALHGFAMLWERSAMECMHDMHWMEKYLVTRGGRSKPTAIEAPQVEWPDNPVEPLHPCQEAFTVEKKLLEDLERLCSLAQKTGETALSDAIQRRFLRKHSKHIKNLADLIQQVARVSKQPGLGLYLLDRELRKHTGMIPWDAVNDPDIQDKGIELLNKRISEGLGLGGMADHCGRVSSPVDL
ncbi:hypothetical protein ASPWEDRAFT_733808 [Aspergillus wentii DTO 134E9]|uniref:Ferritin n=1 Tax=Aspergillus wentii DTO 134E9 TaxID=1073089 RepID=A0A1L9R569_ASPWE|nr:uncharacterized protein ASPWEDRAFT_733808 [Aspergillus wentii DTO 134E9]KAI9927303.1 hypothetical protein MW887_003690 [Aspergillus wentii]OJJ30033.1 hypothetical protein ASPWEDRAFT_733808 [Aspergillus wentii DTO 134E9]